MRRRPARQLLLPMHRHGGARPGAGRPRSSRLVTHVARPVFDGSRAPLHVTLRMATGVWNLRSQRGFACVAHALAAERARGELRVVHFSVQGNHLHLVVEAHDRLVLARRMQGFSIRLARRVNAMMGRRRGRVLGDRYHARVLRTPREVRHVIAYVLGNHTKHAAQAGRAAPAVDRFSSAVMDCGSKRPLVLSPQTWVLRHGWLRATPRGDDVDRRRAPSQR